MFEPINRSDGDGKASVISNDNSNGECLANFVPIYVSHDDEWILDIACSFHIYYKKDYFSSYAFVQI
jgi:hypothetical protein